MATYRQQPSFDGSTHELGGSYQQSPYGGGGAGYEKTYPEPSRIRGGGDGGASVTLLLFARGAPAQRRVSSRGVCGDGTGSQRNSFSLFANSRVGDGLPAACGELCPPFVEARPGQPTGGCHRVAAAPSGSAAAVGDGGRLERGGSAHTQLGQTAKRHAIGP